MRWHNDDFKLSQEDAATFAAMTAGFVPSWPIRLKRRVRALGDFLLMAMSTTGPNRNIMPTPPYVWLRPPF
ncbi:MAG: hypothetical protein K0S68_1096 [Candidatus Saccharibacteria bacterium]|nr:hypothetical protein [Candidatus Saccharibacteria bacterium]